MEITEHERVLLVNSLIQTISELYEHDGQLTKREIRAMTLAALAPQRQQGVICSTPESKKRTNVHARVRLSTGSSSCSLT